MANTKLPARLLDTSAIPALNVTGDLTVDTTTLRVDSINNRVGIGTTSPGKKLQVEDASNQIRIVDSTNNKKYDLNVDGDKFMIDDMTAGANRFTISGSNVGIGTNNPSSTLHIEGNTNTYNTSPLLYFGSTSTANAAVRDWAIGPADSNYGDFHIFQGTSTGASAIGSTQVKFTINASGNVGIGQRTPAKRLQIYDATQTNQSIQFGPHGTAYGEINYNSTGLEHLYIDSHGTTTGYGNIVFRTGPDPATRMFIHADGKVGIGNNTSPAYTFEVKKDVAGDWVSRIYNTSATTGYGTLIRTDATSANDAIALGVYADSGYKMVVRSTGKVGIGVTSVASNALLQVNGGIRFNAFSAGHGLNVVSNQTFNNTNVSNSCGALYYKCFIINFYHNNGHSQVFGLANGGGGVGFDFTIIRPDTATAIHGRPIDFSFTTIGSSPNTFRVQISSGGGAFTVTRTSGTGSFGVQVHNIAGG